MAEANRAVAPPWSIWADHNDSISQRDTGWIQFYCESNQDILDTLIQAYKIAEDSRVLLPAMVCYDGFEISHTAMPLELPDQRDIDGFLGPYNVEHALIDLEKPTTHGNVVSPELYMEFRLLIQKAMENAKLVINETASDFSRRFGRVYESQIQCYKCRDAEIAIVSMGAISSEAKEAIDRLRKEKLPVGAVKLRVFRPFPKEVFQELGKRVRAFVVIDRNISFGMEGALFTELKSALYHLEEKPIVLGFIAGLGGRDIRIRDLTKAARKALNALRNGVKYPEEEWVAIKE
jgi:pyruvate/2-oxoacid:ferredoxin oxidoreductase alpha subunit